MKKNLFNILLAVFMTSAVSESVLAASVVDQEFDPYTLSTGRFISGDAGDEGQSFTVGMEGLLTRIDLQIAQGFDLVPTIEATVREGTTGPVLATTTLIWADLPSSNGEYVTVFDNLSIPVSIGETYSIFLSADPAVSFSRQSVYWAMAFSTSSDLYAGGSALNGNGTPQENIDAGFRTYVAPVPVPAALWLFGSALLALGALKRKKF